MKCPLCEKGSATLSIEKRKRMFRKEEFEIFEYFYKCKSCKEEFTTTEIDTINTNQVCNQYREKYSIPFPVQLTELRERYSISAAKMSEILGLGANQYRLYEGGEIPAASTGTLLSLIMNPKDFKDIVLRKSEAVKIPDKTIAGIDEQIRKEKANREDLKYRLFNTSIIPNRYTGYSIPSFEKFANMVLYFISNAPFKTRLNKLLFYSDFANYKYTGYSISGCRYAAIDMGSVPDQYSLIFGLLEAENIITTEVVTISGRENEKFVPLNEFDKSLFSNLEIKSLEMVMKKFNSLTTPEIMKIAHEERAWIDNIKHKSLIDFEEYGAMLVGV